MNEPTATGDLARVYVDGEPQDPLAAQVFETIRSRGRPIGTMHRVLAVAPKIFEVTYKFAITLRESTKVAREFNELMILRTVQQEGGVYEFAAHRPMALKAGITESQIEALSEWRSSNLFDPHQRAVLAYADALAARQDVPSKVFEELTGLFDAQEIVELTMICGFYVSAARLSCGVEMKPER